MMRKFKKITTQYIIQNKSFDTFKAMKTFAYFNIKVGDKEEAFEIYKDEIIKTYELIKQERRLLCIKTYDRNKELIKEFNKKQLSLWD